VISLNWGQIADVCRLAYLFEQNEARRTDEYPILIHKIVCQCLTHSSILNTSRELRKLEQEKIIAAQPNVGQEKTIRDDMYGLVTRLQEESRTAYGFEND
jgi:hypothetical protein